MQGTISEVGGEVFIVLPQEALESVGISESTDVEVFSENGNLIIRKRNLLPHCRVDSTDYEFYGGKSVATDNCNRCETCSHFSAMNDTDYGVCLRSNFPRDGLLTHKYQNGLTCHV